jgi:hypothetical protein
LLIRPQAKRTAGDDGEHINTLAQRPDKKSIHMVPRGQPRRRDQRENRRSLPLGACAASLPSRGTE